MAFSSISKFKSLVQNSKINHSNKANNIDKVNNKKSSEETNKSSSPTLSMTMVDLPRYEIDSAGINKDKAAEALLNKGYTQDMINNYFDYKNDKYTLKKGYEIKTLGSYLKENPCELVKLNFSDGNSPIKKMFFSESDGRNQTNQFVVLKNGEPVAGCYTDDKDEKFFKEV